MEIGRIFVAGFVILVMISVAYFVSGISIVEGTIFERKTAVEKSQSRR